jgi:hypothetical protein
MNRDLLRWPLVAGLVAVVIVVFVGAAVAYPRLTGDDKPAAGPTTSAASGVPSLSSSPSTSDLGTAGSISGAPGSSDRTGTTSGTTKAPPTDNDPRIVSFTIAQPVKCPTTRTGEVQPLRLAWHATGGVTKIAMSVDNPGIVGSYDTYDGPDGSETFTNFGCRGGAGTKETHVFTIYTVGGGTQVSRTLTISAVANDLDPPTLPSSPTP